MPQNTCAGRMPEYTEAKVMAEVTTKNFGLLIAYVLPGFTLLWGISPFSDTVQSWLGAQPLTAPTVGGFLYVTLGSVAAGLLLSTVRWLVLDTLHHHTGIPRPSWDFSRLDAKLAAFDVLNEAHYRYYQFYGGGLMALLVSYVLHGPSAPVGPADIGWLSAAALLFIGSRDTLRKYYRRVERLLGR